MPNIQQATSKVVFPQTFGKWHCSECGDGSDGYPVSRYLQPDGTWGKAPYGFDTREEIEEILKIAESPDFTLSSDEEFWREEILRDMQRKFERSVLDDNF